MKKWLKRLKRLGIALLLLVALPLAAVIAINAFDELLDAKAAKAGEPRAASVRDADNGCVAMLAMGAGAGADGMAYAQAWLTEARAAAKENRAQKTIPISAKRETRPALCDAIQTACLAAVQDKVSSVNATLVPYTEDLARYEKLIALRVYEEVLDYPFRLDSEFPKYEPMIAAQRAFIVRAALAVQAGKLDDALSVVERDIAFQRVMLSGSRTLIGRMVAAANYTRDLAFVADLLQTTTTDLKPFAPRLTALLKPIAPAALAMDALLESEFGFVKQQLRDPRAADAHNEMGLQERLALRFLYKPNATINQHHGHYTQVAELLRKPPAVLARDGDKLVAAPAGSTLWDAIDNPMGKTLLRAGMSSYASYASYALRLHELDAYNRLLGLGAEIIAADVAAEGIADFVAKADARFHDPYTNKPMAWDAAAKQLSFATGDGPAKRKLFNLENGRVVLRM